jgi:hypothetical protein
MKKIIALVIAVCVFAAFSLAIGCKKEEPKAPAAPAAPAVAEPEKAAPAPAKAAPVPAKAAPAPAKPAKK